MMFLRILFYMEECFFLFFFNFKNHRIIRCALKALNHGVAQVKPPAWCSQVVRPLHLWHFCVTDCHPSKYTKEVILVISRLFDFILELLNIAPAQLILFYLKGTENFELIPVQHEPCLVPAKRQNAGNIFCWGHVLLDWLLLFKFDVLHALSVYILVLGILLTDRF